MSGLRELLEAWNWDTPRSDTRWCSVRCGHHDDRRASARVHIEEGAYTCLACGLKASSPERLVMAVRGCSWRQAQEVLAGLGVATTQSQFDGRPWTNHAKKPFRQGWHRGRHA
jgi:hypothetical protein